MGEDVAALLVVLMLTGGEALEDYATRRARSELDALLQRAPQLAHRVDGQTVVDVRAEEVRPGDVLLSRSVNGAAAVEVIATATAAESQHQRIVALVAGAARSRAPVVRLADRYAVPFTPFSLTLAGPAWWLSGDPVRFAEVLVLATPCPLLIAAPVAFIGGMGRAAREGVIVTAGGVLEWLAPAETVVFDKTGTLTRGRPTLTEVRPEDGTTRDELLATVASVERCSSHVLAAALIVAARERGLPFAEVQRAREEATNGVRAMVGGREVVVGKPAFVTGFAPDTVRTTIGPGHLAVYVPIDGRCAGALLARDGVREEAGATLERLADLGAGRTMLLTGDARETADHVTAELGITAACAQCRQPAIWDLRSWCAWCSVATLVVEVVAMTTQQEQSPRTDGGEAGTRHVVVGYDGSPASVQALTWAAVEVGSTGARLSVLYAGDVWDDGFSAGFLAAAAESGRRLAREGVDWVHQILGGFDDSRVDAVAVEGGPVAALLAASEHADLLVVGNRGRGRVAGALLGSVAFSVTSRARCPVVVVRGEVERRPGPDAPVVVGVDGSHGANDAVVFAAESATRWGARLVVVAAWGVPDGAAADGYGAIGIAELTRWAQGSATIDADVAADLARSGHPDLEVVTRVVKHRPAAALAEASGEASGEAGLVVVGARGRGGLASLFLGSVSHATVHQASCPVAVVRRPDAP